ncbi:MAG: glycoside hydrolase family 3 protein [Spirochaetota bacterium]
MILVSFLLFHLVSLFFIPTSIDASKNPYYNDFFSRDAFEILKNMSLEEKVGQILMFGFWGETLDEDYRRWLSTGRVGNIKIFLRNVKSKEQLQELTKLITVLNANTRHGVPPFIATDEEGGIVNHIRYDGITLAPAAALISATGKVSSSGEASRLIAMTLRELGINMNFAPCVDVLTTPWNRVIRTRSFSSNPEIVYRMSRAFIEEHAKRGILPIVKHFPGHGMTEFDPHLDSNSVPTSLEVLFGIHLYPYQKLMEEGLVDGCMVSHVIYDEIDPLYPAAFSPLVVRGLLREGLRYEGIVITDDLEMEGSESYAIEIIKAFILAFRAGNDIMLLSHTKAKQRKLLDNVAELFRRGILDESELDKRVLRILNTKKRYLVNFYTISGNGNSPGDSMESVIGMVNRISDEGIVLLSSNIKGSISGYFKRAVGRGLRGLILSPTPDFSELSKKYLPMWDILEIGYLPDKEMNFKKLREVQDRLEKYDMIILGFASERQIPWAQACVDKNIPFCILSVDNPSYPLRYANRALFIAASFGPFHPAIGSLFKCVFDTGKFSGFFPYVFNQ